MRVLVYKRTHTSDPDEREIFGICDCMGRVRNFEFDAVIGIGGHGKYAQSCDIAGKVTWIGVGAHKGKWFKRGPRVTFDRFARWDDDGPDLAPLAPKLAKRFQKSPAPRYAIYESENDAEIARLLKLADRIPSSRKVSRTGTRRKCRLKWPPDC